ncbi:fungal-specific transcription factor domain-containing protein [Amylocarpus encephaloides]|uniref:Fungal-specific transcription factor domain-containing protein n=1 Tax=Amylocarpus encephaloides TaxID=45428 RepID=A0A9P8C4S2_9HELO|nr:fungal-specific transcription factor domain-containing protein [Amylocarpus encephaloides]
MPPRIRTVEGSCWSCKERRVICDLTLPACTKCTKTNRQCDYGAVRLKWTDCVASRGRFAGKKVPLYPPPKMRKNNDHHLMYFAKELLPRFNLTNTVPVIDLKMLEKDPVLLQSAVAVAHAHAAYRTDDGKALSLQRIQSRNRALKVFREQLMGSPSDDMTGSLFIANVLLCILDGIIEPISDSSATHHHLVGGKAILKQWPGAKGVFQLKFELPILMLSIFATMDLTHSLLIGDAPYFEASSWTEFGDCESWWGNIPANDDFLKIMAILAKLARLGSAVRMGTTEIEIGTLLAIQQALDKQVNILEDIKPTIASMEWAAFCAVYRFSASVYLYRALSGLQVDHPLVQASVTSCIDILERSELPERLQHCILFPLLVISSHCVVAGQRKAILKSLETTSVYLSFESMRSLQRFLEKRWLKLDKIPESRDMTWWEYFDEIASVSCLF